MAKASRTAALQGQVTNEPQVSTVETLQEQVISENKKEDDTLHEAIVTNDTTLKGLEHYVAPKVKEPEIELSMEDKILNFLKGKNDYVKMNDFLKSLYPIPTLAQPAQWMQQGISKTLRGLLSDMVKDGQITIANNQHLLLGKSYYVGVDQKQAHYNLSSVEIYAKA